MKLGKEEGKSPTDNCCDRAKTVKIALKNVQNKGVEGRLLIVARNWKERTEEALHKGRA